MASDNRHIEDLFDQFIGDGKAAGQANNDEEIIGVKQHKTDQFSFGDVANMGKSLFGGGDKKGFDIGSLLGGGGGSKPAASNDPPAQPSEPKGSEASGGGGGGGGMLDGVLGSGIDFVAKNAALSGILGMISGTKDPDAQKKWIGSFANKLVSDQGATAMAFILKKFQGDKGDKTTKDIVEAAVAKKAESLPPGSEEEQYLSSVASKVQSDPDDPQLDGQLAKILVDNNYSPPISSEANDEEEEYQVKYVKKRE